MCSILRYYSAYPSPPPGPLQLQVTIIFNKMVEKRTGWGLLKKQLVWQRVTSAWCLCQTSLARKRGLPFHQNEPGCGCVLGASCTSARPYQSVHIRGRVSTISEDGGEQGIDDLSNKYLGKDYPWRNPGDIRLVVEIEPESVATMGL